MLRRDPNAHLVKTGFWIFTRYHFQAGRLRTKDGWNKSQVVELLEAQQSEPHPLLHNGANRRTWWMFGGDFYWEDEGYTADEVHALVVDRLRRRAKQINRAKAYMEQGTAVEERRDPIPDEIKILVWQRDQGRCVKCGSKEKLEYDHIIPLAMGGSNTARNLQLLCENCNREKRDSLV